MNQNTTATRLQDSPETLKGCLWATFTAAMIGGFVLLAWIAIQRTEIHSARFDLREAEAKITELLKELDSACKAHAAAANELNARLVKAEEDKRAAEQAANEAASAARQGSSADHVDAIRGAQSEQRGEFPIPSGREFVEFIQEHLRRMAGPVEGQLADYAEEVDFHDKPRASLKAIENDRRQWAQRYPVREIGVKTDVRPEVNVQRAQGGGWVATIVFQWSWQYRTRSGGTLAGVTKDTWKVVPSAKGLRLISEHSADPLTGQPKD